MFAFLSAVCSSVESRTHSWRASDFADIRPIGGYCKVPVPYSCTSPAHLGGLSGRRLAHEASRGRVGKATDEAEAVIAKDADGNVTVKQEAAMD
jgi:hypothetical protein